MKTNKQYLTIDEAFKIAGIKKPDYIVSNPDLTKRNGAEYEIVRQTTHDGTGYFTKELITNTIINLFLKLSYYKLNPPSSNDDRKYEVGLLSLATVFGNVKLPAGVYTGERQRTRLPVKCILI